MKSVDAHLDDSLAGVEPLEAIDLQLLDAHGCILAEEVVAPWAIPGFDNASHDGYAVRAADLADASAEHPVDLPVMGDIPAGRPSSVGLQPGTTMRIMTGAPVPEGADAVVPVEWTDAGIANVKIERTPDVGAHIRRIGSDVVAGQQVLAAGTRLGPSQLGLLAAVGRDRVVCRPKPRVVVLSTGSELVDPGLPLALGQISESNSYALTAAAREAGALAYRVGIVLDDPRKLMDTLEDQLIRADLIVTSGGVSVGAYDVVKEVLSRAGTVQFDKVAMQPGMPQGFGVLGEDEIPVFTLPGNPVSAMVSFEVFVAPALRVMAGRLQHESPLVSAVATHDWTAPAGKVQFARVVLSRSGSGHTVAIAGLQGSHALGGLAGANALAVIPAEVTLVRAGDTVRCHRLGPLVEAS